LAYRLFQFFAQTLSKAKTLSKTQLANESELGCRSDDEAFKKQPKEYIVK